MMYQLHLNFKNKTKRVNISYNLPAEDLANLISNTFNLKQKIVGLINQKGQFLQLKNIFKTILSKNSKEILYLITAQDLNQENISFASQYRNKKTNDFDKKQKNSNVYQALKLPNQLENQNLGLIGDIQLFQELILQQNKVCLLFCFIKHKPKGIQFPYYLYHTNKNSAVIYWNKTKICQFFIQDMKDIPPEILNFVESIMQQKQQSQIKQTLQDQKLINQQLILQNNYDNDTQNDNVNIQIENQAQNQSKNSQDKETEIKQSLLQNLTKLKDQEQISQFQFYKMKSELLENFQQFIRKYQMGTRNGLRKQPLYGVRKTESQKSLIKQNNNQNKNKRYPYPQREKQKESSKSKNRMYSRDQRRSKKYEIPIIVRKYNNVIQKISTSYPLSQDQEQSINLILQLQLKGLISQKQSGIYKSSILQEDTQVFTLFEEYFNGILDQVQLVGKLKRVKKIGSQKRQRDEHNMRLLMKYSRQSNYQLLRTLLLQENLHILNSLQKFRKQKNSQLLSQRLQKISKFYRQKQSLEDILQNLG